MKITRIKIDGYKNIYETEIELGKFNALVALNNYGKTNFIEAIDFAIDFIKANNKEKNSMMQNQSSIPINNATANKDFLFEISFEMEFEKNDYEINYAYSFEWIKQNKQGKKIVYESLKLKKKEKDAKYSTFVLRNSKRQNYLGAKTGRCDKKILIDHNGLIINKLSNFDDLFYLDVVNKLNNIELVNFTLNDIERHYAPGFVFNEREEFGDEPGVTEIPSIAEFFYHLKKDDNEKYKLLINSLMDLMTDIEYIKPIEIDLKEAAGTKAPKHIPFELFEKIYDIRVKIKTNNQDTSIHSLSLGTKRLFIILASIIRLDMLGYHFVSYEELENSIHPALLQRLTTMVSEMASNLRVLITSHSPYLIRYLELDEINIGIPNADGVANFKKIKQSKQRKLLQYAKDADSNVGDFIFDMLVEGFEDKSFWNDFI